MMPHQQYWRPNTGVAAACGLAAILPWSSLKVSAGERAQPRPVPVVATDYAFSAPDTLIAGATAFHLENRGAKKHEIALVLARRGTTAAQIIAAARAGLPAPKLAEAYSDGSPLGALFVAPGEKSRATLVVTLERGRVYVVVCTLRDSPTMPEHAALGMFHVIEIR